MSQDSDVGDDNDMSVFTSAPLHDPLTAGMTHLSSTLTLSGLPTIGKGALQKHQIFEFKLTTYFIIPHIKTGPANKRIVRQKYFTAPASMWRPAHCCESWQRGQQGEAERLCQREERRTASVGRSAQVRMIAQSLVTLSAYKTLHSPAQASDRLRPQLQKVKSNILSRKL